MCHHWMSIQTEYCNIFYQMNAAYWQLNSTGRLKLLYFYLETDSRINSTRYINHSVERETSYRITPSDRSSNRMKLNTNGHWKEKVFGLLVEKITRYTAKMVASNGSISIHWFVCALHCADLGRGITFTFHQCSGTAPKLFIPLEVHFGLFDISKCVIVGCIFIQMN